MATKDDTSLSSLNWERRLQTEDNTLLNEDDIFEVRRALIPVAAKWRAIGEGLGITGGTLDTVEEEHRGKPLDCMDHVVREWLRQNYKTSKFGEPTWRKLVEVVADPAGGGNYRQAKEIARDHLKNGVVDVKVQPSEDNKHKSFFSWRWVTVLITMSVVILALWFQGGALLTTISFHLKLYHSPCLPYPPEVFVGRENEMKEVMQLVNFGNTKNRLVSIVGPPGFGKSTLAIRLGHEMVANGITVYYIDMVEVSSSQALAEKVLDCDAGIVSIENVTVNRLHKWARELRYQTLLILDNCDDMLHEERESLQKTVKTLLESSPKLKVLMTSRERMILSKFSLTQYQLHELRLDASCELLQNVAEGLNSTLCQSIANLTGNVPLALKVVGALLTQLDAPSPEVIISQLNERLISTLSPQELPLDERVNASIGLSYKYLSQMLQKIGRYLANFPGSFDEDSAHSVLLISATKPPPESFKARMLQEFVQRSLLEYHYRTNRYQFHRLIREFFLDIQRSIGDSGRNEARRFINSFQLHYSTMLDSLTDQFASDHKKALATLDIERHNLEQLLTQIQEVNIVDKRTFVYVLTTLCRAIAASFLPCRFTDEEVLRTVHSAVSFLDEKWQHVIRKAVNGHKIPLIYVHLVVGLGDLEQRANGMSSAVEVFLKRKSVIEDMKSHDADAYAFFYTSLSNYHVALDQHDGVTECHERILAGIQKHIPGTCSHLAVGSAYYCIGNYEQSAFFLQQQLLLVEQNDTLLKAALMIRLYESYLHMKNAVKAQEVLEDILALFPSLMTIPASTLLKYYYTQHERIQLHNVIKFYRENGKSEEATALEDRLLKVIWEIGARPHEVSTVEKFKSYAEYLFQIKRYVKAADLAQFVLDSLKHLGEDQREAAEKLKLELNLLAGKAKFWGGNYSNGLDHFEFVDDFIYEHNATTIYILQLKEACPYIFLRGRIGCAVGDAQKIVFVASVKAFNAVFGVLLPMDFNELPPVDIREKQTKTSPRPRVIELSRSTELSEKSDEMAIYPPLSSIPQNILSRFLYYITCTVTEVETWVIQLLSIITSPMVATWIVQNKLAQAIINICWIWVKLILIYYCLRLIPRVITAIHFILMSALPVWIKVFFLIRLYYYISLCLCTCFMLTATIYGAMPVWMALLIVLDNIIWIPLFWYCLQQNMLCNPRIWILLFEKPVIIFCITRLIYIVYIILAKCII